MLTDGSADTMTSAGSMSSTRSTVGPSDDEYVMVPVQRSRASDRAYGQPGGPAGYPAHHPQQRHYSERGSGGVRETRARFCRAGAAGVSST